MTNNYEAPQAIDIGKAQELILDFKYIAWWVDNLGVILYSDSWTFEDYEE